jgi:hypothetical protein
LVRLTMNLTPPAQKALEKVRRRTGANQTDAVNTAISVFAKLEASLSQGANLVHTDATGKETIITIIY